MSEDEHFLPSRICHECDEKLNYYYKFKQDCKKSEYYLIELIKNTPRAYYHHQSLDDVSHHFYKEIAPDNHMISMAYDDVQHIYESSMNHSQEQPTYNHYVAVPQYTPNDENVSEISGYKDEVNIDQFLEPHEPQVHLQEPIVEHVENQMHIPIKIGPMTPPIEHLPHIPQILDVANIQKISEIPPRPQTSIIHENTIQYQVEHEEHDAEPEEEPFDYDDFDENYESGPQSVEQWNNVDDAIEEKIEEFRNKKKRPNPKICPICNKLFRTPFKLKSHMK